MIPVCKWVTELRPVGSSSLYQMPVKKNEVTLDWRDILSSIAFTTCKMFLACGHQIKGQLPTDTESERITGEISQWNYIMSISVTLHFLFIDKIQKSLVLSRIKDDQGV